MGKRIVRFGSRESKLAVVQARLVMNAVAAAHPDLELELVTMKTTGDKILDKSLATIGGKGLFVRELDRALEEDRVDLCVHSLKDLPMETPKELPVMAFTHREDPRDALILPAGAAVPASGLPIGSSSKRRAYQLHSLFPDLDIKSVRGNVQTRLLKLENGEYGALVLAAAGLKRLDMTARITRFFTVEEVIPAAGQGILAVQGRAGEDYRFLDCIMDGKAQRCALAERAFVRALGGGCTSPVAAYAQINGGVLHLSAFYFNEETGRGARSSRAGSPEEAESVGAALAEDLKGRTLP